MNETAIMPGELEHANYHLSGRAYLYRRYQKGGEILQKTGGLENGFTE